MRSCWINLIHLFLSVSLLSAAQDLFPSQLEAALVTEIQFTSDGRLDRISDESLRKLVVIETDKPFRAGAARATINRLFATGLFEDVQIIGEPSGEGRLRIMIQLRERIFIREIQWEGAERIPSRELNARLQLSPGEPFAIEAVDPALQRVKELYRENGYYEAGLAAQTEFLEKRGEVRLRIKVTPGPRAHVRRLELESSQASLNSEILELLQLKVDEPYSNRLRDEGLERIVFFLVHMGYLNPLVYVSEGPRYDPRDQSVELVIRVDPREKTQIEFEGLPVPIEMISELNLYRDGDPSEIFVQESALELTRQLQEMGYVQTQIDYQLNQDSGSTNRVVFLISPGPKAELERIEFEGDPGDSRQQLALRTLLEVQTSGFLRRPRYSNTLRQRDEERIRSFWSQRGHLQAQVSGRLELIGEKATLIFNIQRGPLFRIGELRIEKNQEISTDRLNMELGSKPGDPYSPLLVAQGRANLSAFYENLGYREVDIQVEVSIQEQRVDVVFTISEGPQLITDSVIVTGNRKTQERVIRREFQLKAGEPLSLGRILGAESSLHDLAIFNRIQVRDSPSFRDENERAVIVQVEEAPRFSLVYGFGYSSFEGPRGTVGITNSNVLGTARSLSLALRAGARRQRGSLTYSLPRFARWRIPAVLSLAADKEQAQFGNIGGVRANRGRPFDSFRLTASAQTEARLSRRESLFFRLAYERVRSSVPETLATALEFFRAEEKIDLSSVSASYLNESRDNPSDPTRGFFLTGDTQIASRLLGSDEELFRLFSQGQFYKSLAPQVVWASALRLGFIRGFGRSDSVPISERFFSGGSATLRGLPQDLAGPLLKDDETGEIILVDEFGQIQEDNSDPNARPVPTGGEALLILNTEIRFPIYRFVRGVVFYDVGNVYEKVADLFTSPPTHSPGLGLHFETPVGPVRLDVGYNPNPPDLPGFSSLVFHLTLGHPF